MSPGLVGGLIKTFTVVTGKRTGDLNETMNVTTADVSVFGHAVAVENSSNFCCCESAPPVLHSHVHLKETKLEPLQS